MIRPIKDGFQSLVGTTAEVVSKLVSDGSAKYLVRSQGELWSAHTRDTLKIGEQVNIVAVKGIGVVVERAENSSRPGGMGNAKIMASGAKDTRRHCH